MRKKTKEEITSGKRSMEEDMDMVAADCKRDCLDYRFRLGGNLFEEHVVEVSEAERERENVGGVKDWVLVSDPNLISLVDFVCDLVSFSVSEFEFDVARKISISRMRSTNLALEREQHKKAKACLEVTPIQTTLVPRRTPFKAVPNNVRNKARIAPEGARQADVAWTTVGPTTLSGRHAPERPHLPQREGSGIEVSAGQV